MVSLTILFYFWGLEYLFVRVVEVCQLDQTFATAISVSVRVKSLYGFY